MTEDERKKIAEKVLDASTLKYEITPLYNDAALRWQRTVVSPYGNAYTKAYEAVMAAVKDQIKHYDEIENIKFELTMAALAVVGGSVLTSVFADSSLKNAAKEAALDYVCKKEMINTFNTMEFVASNPVPSFVAGKIWDTAEGQALGQVKKRLEPKSGAYKSLGQSLTKPWEVRQNVEDFNLELRERGIDTLWAIRNLTISRDLRLKLLMLALKSQYLSPPKTPINGDALIPKIKLALYMQVLMASDKVHYQRVGRRMRSVPGYSRKKGPSEFYKDVPQRAGGKQYPTADSGIYTKGNVYNTSIKMPGVGNDFMRSIDKAHKEVNNKDFFTWGEYWEWEFDGNEVKSIVKRAEQASQGLAKINYQSIIARKRG